MNDLFLHELQDVYYAEEQLVKALPKMAEKATDKRLKQGFLTHLDETKTHVQRLEQIFQMLGAKPKAVDCPAIDGIIEEADEVAGEVADKSVLNAALINAAHAAEHYEIARYGSRWPGQGSSAATISPLFCRRPSRKKKPPIGS
jgi:ferritin-like metal-binding protein YciE